MLITRSPLAFPAGFAPGFDPSHLASPNIRLSAIPQGTNMVSLLTGRPGTFSGAAVTKSMTMIGPGARTGGWFSSSMSTFSGGPAIVLNEPFTLAAIIMYDDVTGGMTAMRNTSSGSYGAQLITQGSMAVGLNGSVTIGPSGQSFVSVGRSYFVACSWLYGFGAHVVSTDLQSGKIVYEFMNSGTFQHLGGAGDPTCFGSVNGSYGPAMCSAAYMSKAQLLAWAADPWLFWYPHV